MLSRCTRRKNPIGQWIPRTVRGRTRRSIASTPAVQVGLPCHLPICRKSLVESHKTAGMVFGKRQSQHILLGDPLIDQIRDVSEAETLIILRVADQDTASGSQGLQPGESLLR